MTGKYDTEDEIAALATPRAAGAIAVIRTSGKRCLEKASRCFSRPKALKAAPGGTFLYGKILDPATKEAVDEVIVSVSRAPRSYTGGDCLEISCHGGIPGVGAVLAALRAVGFRDALPGEFTLRAFINGKLDLTQAEAVASLIDAKTKTMHEASLRTLDGAVFRELSEIRRILIDASAAVEVQLDYAEDDLDDAVAVPVHCFRDSRHHTRLFGGECDGCGLSRCAVRYGRIAEFRRPCRSGGHRTRAQNS